LERTWASRKLGTAIAARIAMMATTIKSSMRVKPFVFLLLIFIHLSFLWAFAAWKRLPLPFPFRGRDLSGVLERLKYK